ncbi:hypothetical protein LIER_18489 [Lithospermum erythrorhizon]|uniref:Uncharacterized protein n=1 Tax=Lithospermum erythrorhizon TaxID=34254 RepID=A0AAV3QF61_LITER
MLRVLQKLDRASGELINMAKSSGGFMERCLFSMNMVNLLLLGRLSAAVHDISSAARHPWSLYLAVCCCND